MSRVLLVLAGVATLLSTGCTTLTVRKDKCEGVKSAAIVAYSAFYQLDPDANKQGKSSVLDVINDVSDMVETVEGKTGAERVEQATLAFTSISGALDQELKWKMMPHLTMLQHKDYMAWAAERESSLANASQSMGGMALVPGLAPAWSGWRLDPGERDRLASALGVDAIIVVELHYGIGDTSGFALGGIGKVTYHPNAVVRMSVFAKGEKEPIWEEKRAVGKPASDGFDKTMGIERKDRLHAALKDATHEAIKALLKRYRGA